jgi:uncharacterized RDD family membrane protein YckC
MNLSKFPEGRQVFTAMLIDLIIVNIIGIIIVNIYSAICRGFIDKYTLSYIGFAIYCLCLLYVPVLSALAQTVGQKLMGIKIVSDKGEQANVLKAIVRWLFSIVSLFGYNSSNIPWFDRKLGLRLISIK